MKRKLFGLAILVGIIIAGFFWNAVNAQSFKSGDKVNVGTGEVLDSMLWASGRTVDIAGEVNGDVFCLAQTVTISGTVHGDVLCAAQHIVISGTVNGDVRVVGQSVTIGAVGIRNLSVGSQDFVQEAKSTVANDASIAADHITLNGSIGRDAAIAGSDVTLAGSIGRNVESTVTNLTLGSNATVGGNLDYTSKNNAKIASGAVVDGETTKSSPKSKPKTGSVISTIGFSLGFALYALIAGLIVSLILVMLFPQAIHATTSQAIRSPWKVLLVGLIAAIVVPALIVLCLITIVAIPLGLLLLGFWLLINALAGILSAYWLGRVLMKNQRNPILIMLVGSLLLIVLYFIPVIGIIAVLLAVLMGVGMQLLELKQRWPMPNYKLPSK